GNTDDAHRHPYRDARDQQRPVDLVRRRAGDHGVFDLCHDPLPAAARSKMSNEAREPLLDPVDRVSEFLFGLFMALTFVGAVSVATDGKAEIKTMFIAALGCNLAWG